MCEFVQLRATQNSDYSRPASAIRVQIQQSSCYFSPVEDDLLRAQHAASAGLGFAFLVTQNAIRSKPSPDRNVKASATGQVRFES